MADFQTIGSPPSPAMLWSGPFERGAASRPSTASGGLLEITEADTERSWTLWVTSQSLRDEMNSLKPRVGDRLKVVFEGTGIAEKSGHEFQRWKVELLNEESARKAIGPSDGGLVTGGGAVLRGADSSSSRFDPEERRRSFLR